MTQIIYAKSAAGDFAVVNNRPEGHEVRIRGGRDVGGQSPHVMKSIERKLKESNSSLEQGGIVAMIFTRIVRPGFGQTSISGSQLSSIIIESEMAERVGGEVILKTEPRKTVFSR